ncbi:hypothetical protein [Pedobacter frigoris]|uniref:hypothetical protein n=1 Tax=Pedobacter frigoris TaxID=2571272 RepID=UPI002931E1E9|nr:hypothetical protein [Pedobacter frigoris]
MKYLYLLTLGILLLGACTQNSKTTESAGQNSASKSSNAAQPNSQYVIEANTMIFHDSSVDDPITSRRFFRCDDVFSLGVYAKLYPSTGTTRNFRVISIIYDEKKVLDINLDDPTDPPMPTAIESYLLGYNIENGYGSISLSVVKPSDFAKTEIYVQDIKSSISALTNMAYDSRNVMADQIVNKKYTERNNTVIPYRRMNVFSDNIYIKNPMNNSKMKVIDIYRPAEIEYSIRNSAPISSVKWFLTAIPTDADGKNANGNLYYVPNPRIVEK